MRGPPSRGGGAWAAPVVLRGVWVHGSPPPCTTTGVNPTIAAQHPPRPWSRFRRIVTSTTSAPGPTAAWLGEIVVHAQDIRRPLGLVRMPQIGAVTEVARFYARRNFTVAGRTAIQGLPAAA